MSDEIWERVWAKKLIISDYSLKYLDFINTLKTDPGMVREFSKRDAVLARRWPFSLTTSIRGVDISGAALRLAQKNCSNAVLGSIFSMPFDDNAFDLVYNSGVIEHFRDPENIAALQEMARVVKPSGKIVVIVPNTLCLWYKAGKSVAVLLKNFEFGYEEDYSLPRLEHAMERAVDS